MFIHRKRFGHVFVAGRQRESRSRSELVRHCRSAAIECRKGKYKIARMISFFSSFIGNNLVFSALKVILV